ncbi:ComEC/Rec2 family competence protein, partial [Desulfovibrio sp. OttesenSCG-928-G11]|nr:ComEC/Rec2 family competence protein [Desulfovibrio sp. OttesenSCG-928-G11]
MQRSRLGLLLFSEVCLLAGISGIMAMRYPAPGLFCLALIWLLDLPRSKNAARSLALLLLFCLGAGYAAWREPAPPPVPYWLSAASLPAPGPDGEILPPGALRIAARVERSEYLPGNRLRVVLSDLRPAASPLAEGEALAPYPGLCVWTWYRPQYHPESPPLSGSRILATVRLAPQRALANPGSLNLERYWPDRGVFFRAFSGSGTDLEVLGQQGDWGWSAALARHELRQRFLDALPRDDQGRIRPSAAILPALIFGDRSLLSPEQNDLFARSTLAHSLALSGLHMGFAVLAGALTAFLLTRAVPRIGLYLPRPKLALLFALPFALFYLWLGQAPPSLCRAACMLFFWTALLLLNRPRVLLDGLMAALAFLLLQNPLALFDLSLQLSALCVAVIALSAPGLAALGSRLFPAQGRKPSLAAMLGRGCLGILGISLAIQAALLPLVLRAFGSSGLSFPLNLIWLPALSLIVLPLAFAGLAASALGLPEAAAALLLLADAPGQGLLMLLEGLDNAGLLLAPLLPRPHWLSMAGYWLLCLGLPGLLLRGAEKTRRSRSFFLQRAWVPLLGLCLLLAPPALRFWEQERPGVSLTLFDVGQGEAMLIAWQGLGAEGASGRALLDGGGFASPHFDTGRSILAPALTDQAPARLAMVLNSHPDTDHLGGLPYILERFQVGAYYGNGDRPTRALEEKEKAALARSGLEKEPLCAGRTLELAPDLWLQCLWPPEAVTVTEAEAAPRGNEKGNNRSLAL